MKVKLQKSNSLTELAIRFAIAAASIVNGIDGVGAKPKQKHDDASIYYYGPDGPNRSYPAGPHTRIYVTTRSWLDAGTEVLPGDRKFSDYAFPPGYSFARENNNRSLDRQPLNPPADMGGYLMSIPLD